MENGGPGHPEVSKTESSRRFRIPFWLGIMLFFGYLSLGTFFFPTQKNTSTYITSYLVEKAMQAPQMLQGSSGSSFSHIFQEPFYYRVGRVLAFFNYHGRMLPPLKMVNLFFAAMAVLVLYMLLLNLTGEPFSSFIAAAFLGFGYGFWYWSSHIYCYDIGIFFALLSLFCFLRFPGWIGILLAGASTALAAGFAIMTLPSAAVMLLAIFLFGTNLRTRLLHSTAYLLATAAFFMIFLSLLRTGGISPGFIFSWTAGFLGRFQEMFARSHQDLSLISNSQVYFLKTGLYRIFKWNLLPAWLEMSCPEGNIVYDRSPAAIGLNEILNRIILFAIFLVTALGLSQYKKIGSRNRKTLLFSLAWVLVFGLAFFLFDPFNYLVIITFTGVIFMIGTVSGVSRINRAVMGAALLMLFLGNFHQVLSGNRPDPVLKKVAELSGTVRFGDFCLVRDPGDTEWALMYCYMLELAIMGEREARDLAAGRIEDNLAGMLGRLQAGGKTVFFNATRFEKNMRLAGFEVSPGWEKALSRSFKVSEAFVLPDYHEYFSRFQAAPVHSMQDLFKSGAFADRVVEERYLSICSR